MLAEVEVIVRTSMAEDGESRTAATSSRALEQRVKLRQLQVLLVVVEQGGLTRAARKLGITQPAVSKIVGEIEAILEMPVLERDGRRLLPTPAGESLLRSARRITREMQALGEDMALLRSGGRGKVLIGIRSVSTYTLMAETVAAMKARSPRETIHLEEGALPELLERLRGGRLDLVVGRMDPLTLGEDLEGVALVNGPTSLITSPGHPILDRIPLDWHDATAQPWCLPVPGTPVRDNFDAFLRSMRIELPADLVETNCIVTMLMLQSRMSRLALAPTALAMDWAARGLVALVDVELPAPTGPIGLIWPKDARLAPTARLFREVLIETALRTTASGALRSTDEHTPIPPIVASSALGPNT